MHKSCSFCRMPGVMFLDYEFLTFGERSSSCTSRLCSEQPFVTELTPVLVSLHWLPIKSSIVFKILLLTYKVLERPSSILSGRSNSTITSMLCSQNAALFVVSKIFRGRMGGGVAISHANVFWGFLNAWSEKCVFHSFTPH